MVKVDPALVPEGMNVVLALTPHCFINGDGRVVFLRRQQEGRYIPMVLETVYDAVSQCFHILDRSMGEAVDFYCRQPVIRTEGEIGQIRGVVLEIQNAVAALISLEGVSGQGVKKMAVAFSQIVQRLGQARNAYRLAVVANLNQSRSARGNDPKRLGEILAPAMAHLAALKRFDELLNIAGGVVVQTRQLIAIAQQGEDRIKKVYETLGVYEARVGGIIKEIERIQREAGVRCPPSQLVFLRWIAHEVGHPGANKVTNALNGVVRVEPFKSRVESAEVRRLARLDKYLDQWQEGTDSALYTFQRTFGIARGRLKRLVRERSAARERRVLELQYVPALN